MSNHTARHEVIGVIGAGNMGSGIAQKYASESFKTIVFDLSSDALDKGKSRIEETLAQGVERRVFSPAKAQEILQNLVFTTDLQELANCTLIIEAIFEDIDAKKSLFKQLDHVCNEQTIFATNTSSFYVSDLASATKRADKFVGLHYFYHPAKNQLVEVIKGSHTSETTFKTAWSIQEKLNKIPIESKDSPGFIVNRFFVPWLNESMRIVDEGLANIATVEAAAKETFEIGMGPFELMNITGVPITFHAATGLAKELGDFYAPSSLIVPIIEKRTSWDLTGKVDAKKLSIVATRLLKVVSDIAIQMVTKENVCIREDCDLGARVGLRWKKGPFELMGQTPQFISSSIDGHIGTITFNKPDSMNALNETMIAQLHDIFEKLSKDPEVKGILIKGRGKAFVAGADTRFFVEKIQSNQINHIVEFARTGQELFREIDTCHKTVIACIDGLALGGGLELALACDYIIATPKSKLGFPETGIGIYPGLGGSQRTPRRVGLQMAKWLISSGEILSSEKALRIGLVDDVVSSENLIKRATDMINQLASKAPIALARVDELLRYSDTHSLDEGLAAETAGLNEIFSTQDALIGLSSIGKNKPVFCGR